MKFVEFADFLQEIENVSSRNEMGVMLASMFEKLNDLDASASGYLIQGRVAPYFVNSEFQMSDKSLINVCKKLSNDDVASLRDQLGDIGLVFEKIIGDKEASDLTLFEVYERLWEIVNCKGVGSALKKEELARDLILKVSGIEAKYIARIIVGDMRLGISDKSILDSLSHILSGDKSSREILDNAYGVSCDIGYIASVVLKNKDISDVAKISALPGIPILSRLVERAKGFEELGERMGSEYIIQPKFDGLRLQIHKNSEGFGHSYESRVWSKYMAVTDQSSMFATTVDTVKLFTRNLEDVTEMFPEIVRYANELPTPSFILDSEVIGWNYKEGKFLSYQETMTRRRKYGVAQLQDLVPVKSFVFDCMYIDGNSVINISTKDRVELIPSILKNDDGEIVKAESITVNNIEQLKSNFDKWVDAGLEGLIAKKFDGGYTPGGRNFEWIKLKKSFMSELSDTVDLVVLGYYRGSGKRAKFGIGALLCGVYNDKLDRYESVTKLGTGITDEEFIKIKEVLDAHRLNEIPINAVVSKILTPDVWVEPKIVCTVEADEITKAINKEEGEIAGGLSLRFPRLIEFDRDKLPSQATTVSELVSLAS